MTFEALPYEPGGLPPAAGADPTNPFVTESYFGARRAMGQTGFWLSGDAASGPAGVVASAFLHQGRWTRRLELPSLPGDAAAAFWDGLLGFCRGRRIDGVQLDSFASSGAPATPLQNETHRWSRSEFVIDLGGDDLLGRTSTTHRQRIRQGMKSGLEVVVSRSADACAAHVRLISASMGRRAERGEMVAGITDPGPFQVLLNAGAGELFQAVDSSGTAIASMLVLRAPRGGYDHSSGSTPEGKKTGASHFLIYATASRLAEEGCSSFNLGGAREDESGLRDFKLRFGSREVALHAIRLDLQSPLRRVVGGLLRRLGARQ